MSVERIRELVFYNQMQIQLVYTLYRNEYMGVVLTPEMRETLKELFDSLRRKIFKTPSILHNITRREKIGRHVNAFLPNILNTLIVGERGTGKSSYIKRLKRENYDRRYFRTGNEPHLIYKQHSNDSSLGCYFNCRLLSDIDEINEHPIPQLFKYANVAFIFYSVTSHSLPTYRKIPEWIDKILSVVPNCKIFICANMIDSRDWNFYIPNPYRNKFYLHRDVEYSQFPLSTASGRDFEVPINETLTYFESIGLIHRTKKKTDLYQTFVREESLKSKYNDLSPTEYWSAIEEAWKKSSWSIS